MNVKYSVTSVWKPKGWNGLSIHKEPICFGQKNDVYSIAGKIGDVTSLTEEQLVSMPESFNVKIKDNTDERENLNSYKFTGYGI